MNTYHDWRGHEHPTLEEVTECTDVTNAIRRAFEHQKTCNWQCEKCLALLEAFGEK